MVAYADLTATETFAHTGIEQVPWYVVDADYKRLARLNCIRHLLDLIPYEDLTPAPVELPPRRSDTEYERQPITSKTRVPDRYGKAEERS